MKLSLEILRPAVGRAWKNMRSVCALQSCRNTMFLRTIPQSRVGITVGQLWYCSVDCFAAASRLRFSALTDGRIMEMPHSPRLSIGLVMLSKSYLTDEQLRYATTQSQMHGEELESAVIRLGFVSERQLAAARAAQWGYPVLGPERIGQPVEADIPGTMLRRCSAVPLHYSVPAKRFLLGFVYRVEHSFLQSLEEITGYRAEPCFITAADFAEQMDRLTSAPNYEEVVFEDLRTPSQMAKTVGGFAVEIGASEASFAQCRNCIWIRLRGRRRTVDVLFQLKAAPEAARRQNSVLLEDSVGSLG